MHVVATAGHVDHGKSTLIKALTGTDPDRLEEEKARQEKGASPGKTKISAEATDLLIDFMDDFAASG